MRRSKSLALALCALAMAAALAGCGEKMTAEKLAEKMIAAARENPMTQLTMSMELDASVGAQGITMDIAADLAADAKMSLDSNEAYMDVGLTMSMLGEEVTEAMEVYLVEEEGQMASYVCMESTGQWIRESVELETETAGAPQSASHDWLLRKTGDELVLKEEKVEVNGSEAYVLTTVLTWDDVATAMESMDNAALEEALDGASLEDILAESGLGDVDLSVLRVPIVYHVDAKTYLPLRIEGEVEGLDVLLSDVMAAVMGSLTDEELEVDITVDVCRLVLDNIGCGPADIPALPAEAADAVTADELAGLVGLDGLVGTGDSGADDEAIADLGAGPFDFQYGNIELTVTLPEGWTATEIHADMIFFANEDGASNGDFTLYTLEESSYEDLTAVLEDSLEYWLDAGEYDSHGDLGVPGCYTLWIRFTDGSVYYYGICPLEDAGHLTFSLYDAYGTLTTADAVDFLVGVTVPV